MNDVESASEAQATRLCTSCGMCCTGHLFIWAKLRPAELDPAEALGLTVYRDDPNQRGFSQPCPLWKGLCTIHNSRHYPHVCRAYKCKLLKELLAERSSLTDALEIIAQARQMVGEIEVFLPPSANMNFRERLVAYLEHPEEGSEREDYYLEFHKNADRLLLFYAAHFGVTDLVES